MHMPLLLRDNAWAGPWAGMGRAGPGRAVKFWTCDGLSRAAAHPLKIWRAGPGHITIWWAGSARLGPTPGRPTSVDPWQALGYRAYSKNMRTSLKNGPLFLSITRLWRAGGDGGCSRWYFIDRPLHFYYGRGRYALSCRHAFVWIRWNFDWMEFWFRLNFDSIDLNRLFFLFDWVWLDFDSVGCGFDFLCIRSDLSRFDVYSISFSSDWILFDCIMVFILLDSDSIGFLFN